MHAITEKLQLHLSLSFQMLENVIESCPDTFWVAQEENESIWKRVLHTLESIDHWMVDFSDYHYKSLFDAYTAEMDQTCSSPPLSKKELLSYKDLLKPKIDRFFSEMDDERLTTHSSVHPATTFLDIILSQIRHIQMNVGYFNQILNSSDLRSPLWLGYNEG